MNFGNFSSYFKRLTTKKRQNKSNQESFPTVAQENNTFGK